jgi:hypothetical protein
MPALCTSGGPRNTSTGAQFSLGDTLGTYKPDLNSIKIDKIKGGYLELSLSPTNRIGLNLSDPAQAKLAVTSDNSTTIQDLCQGWELGAMQISRTLWPDADIWTDEVESLIFGSNSPGRKNLYVCATGIRASVKNMGFRPQRHIVPEQPQDRPCRG